LLLRNMQQLLWGKWAPLSAVFAESSAQHEALARAVHLAGTAGLLWQSGFRRASPRVCLTAFTGVYSKVQQQLHSLDVSAHACETAAADRMASTCAFTESKSCLI